MNQMIFLFLLMINVTTCLLLIIHMIKFRQMNGKFNRVVRNVQTYLQVIMGEEASDEGPKTETADKYVSANQFLTGYPRPQDSETAADGAMVPSEQEQKEALLGQILGEIFS